MTKKLLGIFAVSFCLSLVLILLNFSYSMMYKETKVVDQTRDEYPDELHVLKAISATELERGVGINSEMTEQEMHSDPYVLHVRTSLNNYVNGVEEGVEEVAVFSEMANCGLSLFRETYFESPFIVLSAINGEYGGVFVDIVFLDKPDSIFSAWVYQYDSGQKVLRSFCKIGPSEENVVDFNNMMDEVKKNKDYYKEL